MGWFRDVVKKVSVEPELHCGDVQIQVLNSIKSGIKKVLKSLKFNLLKAADTLDKTRGARIWTWKVRFERLWAPTCGCTVKVLQVLKSQVATLNIQLHIFILQALTSRLWVQMSKYKFSNRVCRCKYQGTSANIYCTSSQIESTTSQVLTHCTPPPPALASTFTSYKWV